MADNAGFRLLTTGVHGLDRILGGGLPEYSVNLIGGTSGSGKTILAHQMLFHMAREGRRVAYFAAIGESLLKMLRYQQRFAFFDAEQVGKTVHFVDLTAQFQPQRADAIIGIIFDHIRLLKPDVVFIDSFRSIMRGFQTVPGGAVEMQGSLNQLALLLSGWQSTSFLISTFHERDEQNLTLYTIADGIIELIQDEQKSSMVRKLQVKKIRGMPQISGSHAFRISETGLTVYPRTLPVQMAMPPATRGVVERVGTGLPELDAMMDGGLPAGYNLLVVGPSGSGKSMLATEFIKEGARRGEPCVLASFETHLEQIHQGEIARMVDQGAVQLLALRALDLSVDMAMHSLSTMLEQFQPKRLVFDSLSAFELSLAPEFRSDFRESMYRLLTLLSSQGVTILMTAELNDKFGELSFSEYDRAFPVDGIVMQRYVEYEGQLRTVMGVVKLRGSAHSRDLRLYRIDNDGIHIESTMVKLPGILTGRTGLAFRHAQEED